ncbi:GNAT superfamily N-acetyltransferase [Streptacidiphilus sp. MAP12-16]|uniref:GNAT family N-acetyltransferase n=1 Tax=Streptacidiphilus sp. MAP12-16 TaxID=3156300 RepID=UPI003515F5CF
MGENLDQVRIVRLGADPAPPPSAGEVDAWHAVLAACAAVDEPGAAVPERASTAATLRAGRPGTRALRWLAWEGDSVVGIALLRLFDEKDRDHLGRFRIQVHPERRRHGVGTALLAEVRGAALADGRASLIARAGTGAPGDAFLAASGAALALESVLLRLRVADCDQAALRATVRAASPGYHLVRWPGVAPGDLIGTFAAAREAMNDMPTDALDHGRTSWDEERVRGVAQAIAARGDTLLTVAALGLDGEGQEVVAGFSEIVLPAGDPTRARQSDTAVLKAHRGRGLGLWVKAAMLQWLLGAHPEVQEVATACAVSNTHMIAINEQLGFRPHGGERHYQLALTGR